MAITFSGLSSGIDSSSLITQLVAAEKQPERPLMAQQSNLASQKQIVNLLSSAMSDFGTFADSMSLKSGTQFRASTTSDSHVSVAVSGDASASTHAVRVDQLARAQVVSSKTFPADVAGMLGTGGVTFQTGTGVATSVSWGATDTLESIASKINGSNAGVAASVLYDGSSYRLMVNASKTGTTNAATFTDNGDGLGLGDAANVKVPPQDAKVTIDGFQVTRPTNVIDDALTGVTITAMSAQAATEPDTQVAVTLDTAAAAAKLGSFVSSFNNIMGKLSTQLTYTGTTAGADTLFADSDLEGLQNRMTSMVSQRFGGTTLDGLGLSIDKTGIMTLDSSKLTTALAKDPDTLAKLFVTGGFSSALRSLDNSYTEAGDGIFTNKIKGMTDQTASIQKQIDSYDANAAALQTRLQAQFTALEATMSAFSAQSTTISALLKSS